MQIPPSSSGRPGKARRTTSTKGQRALTNTRGVKKKGVTRAQKSQVKISQEVAEKLMQTLPEKPKGNIQASKQAEAVKQLAQELTNPPIVLSSNQVAALRKLNPNLTQAQIGQLSATLGKKMTAGQFTQAAEVGLGKYINSDGTAKPELKQAMAKPDAAIADANNAPSGSDSNVFSLTALLLLLAELNTQQDKTMDKAMQAQNDMVVSAIKTQAAQIITKAWTSFGFAIAASVVTLATTSIAMKGSSGFGSKGRFAFKAQEGMQASMTGQQIGQMVTASGGVATGYQEADIKRTEADQSQATFYEQRATTDEQRRADQQSKLNGIVDAITQSDVDAKKAAARGMA